MEQQIIDLGFTYVNDPFMGYGYKSTETCMKRPSYESITGEHYETFRFFIKSYRNGWYIVDSIGGKGNYGSREIVYNIVDIKSTLEKMKKAQDAL